jgi:hypothetical protein
MIPRAVSSSQPNSLFLVAAELVVSERHCPEAEVGDLEPRPSEPANSHVFLPLAALIVPATAGRLAPLFGHPTEWRRSPACLCPRSVASPTVPSLPTPWVDFRPLIAHSGTFLRTLVLGQSSKQSRR